MLSEDKLTVYQLQLHIYVGYRSAREWIFQFCYVFWLLAMILVVFLGCGDTRTRPQSRRLKTRPWLRVWSAARTSADSQPTKLRGVFFWLSTFFEGGEGSTSLERGNRVSCCLIITVISFWIWGVAAKGKQTLMSKDYDQKMIMIFCKFGDSISSIFWKPLNYWWSSACFLLLHQYYKII